MTASARPTVLGSFLLVLACGVIAFGSQLLIGESAGGAAFGAVGASLAVALLLAWRFQRSRLVKESRSGKE